MFRMFEMAVKRNRKRMRDQASASGKLEPVIIALLIDSLQIRRWCDYAYV